MAINVNNLTYDQAKDYYLNYKNGTDDTGIGAQVAKSSRWKGFLEEWGKDETDYKDEDGKSLFDKKNLKAGAAGTSLGLGAGSALFSLLGGGGGLLKGLFGGLTGGGGGILSKLFGGNKTTSTDAPAATKKKAEEEKKLEESDEKKSEESEEKKLEESDEKKSEGSEEKKSEGSEEKKLEESDEKKSETEESKDENKSGPGTLRHAIMTSVTAAMGMASALITQAAQKKSIAAQDKAIKATQKEFEYDFNAKMMEADAQKEYAAMEYEEAMGIVAENEDKASKSDAVSSALANSNKGLSGVAADRSAVVREGTGKDVASITDDVLANGGAIDNNINEFNEKAELSAQMVPYGQEAANIDKQNKIAMTLSTVGALMTGKNCISGMMASGKNVANYLIYGAAAAMAVTTGVISVSESKKAAEAEAKAEMFTTNSQMLYDNALAATAETEVQQAEYDGLTADLTELSKSYGGKPGQVEPGDLADGETESVGGGGGKKQR
ncbi:hypothetical protein IJI31_02680 [bacterium]|nr:hypothetical protein [bacterium]